MKGRLDLEHCSGQTVATVQQDFHAIVLLSNVESVVVGPAQAQLAERTAGRAQPAQINRAVSLHALKHRLIELLTSRVPAAQILAELTERFQANPVSVRPGRKGKRREFSSSRSYHYQRRARTDKLKVTLPAPSTPSQVPASASPAGDNTRPP